MHWSRVKTILIFLFLFVDIILAGYILMNVYSPEKISDSTIRETKQILSRSGITLETEIPSRVERMGTVEMESIWPDNQRLAEKLLGAAAVRTAGGYTNGEDTLTVSEGAFMLSASASAADNGEIFDFLRSRGIAAEEKYAGEASDNMFMRQTIDGKPIFETGVSFSVNGDEALLEGYWIISEKPGSMSKKNEVKLLPITSVLIDFIANPHINKNGETITAIETGYTLGVPQHDVQHKLVSVFPAYKITSKTDSYIYGAVSGEFLYSVKTPQ